MRDEKTLYIIFRPQMRLDGVVDEINSTSRRLSSGEVTLPMLHDGNVLYTQILCSAWGVHFY
jgi:hypothetical protein